MHVASSQSHAPPLLFSLKFLIKSNIIWTLKITLQNQLIIHREKRSDICTTSLIQLCDNHFFLFVIKQKQWREKEEARE